MATTSDRLGERSQARAHTADLRRPIPFVQPQSSPWVVTLPTGAVAKLLLRSRGSSMDDRYFVYADWPSADSEAVVHIHRSWTRYTLADITIKIPRNSDGARITKITYEASHKRWDYEMMALANLDTAKGFAMHSPTWNDIDARFQKATNDFFAYLKPLEEEQQTQHP
ncbi:hypothetical protein F4803DRAFT_563755 [Xylaria telfairii]|nr:hypothetical protein F4803DRAFT_563755 [Xylaria telfairii]